MFVAQVCPRYYPSIGGVETHVREISERLARKNVDVEILTTDPSGRLPREEWINSVKVKRFKSYAPNDNYHFSSELKKYLNSNAREYDVVHAHSYHDFPALYAAEAEDLNRFIFTPHYHGSGHALLRSLLLLPYRVYGKKIFGRADRVICVSNYERNLVLKHFGEIDEKTTVIPNGVNTAEFLGQEKKTSRDRKIVLYVGRLERYKGVQYLIEVLPLLGHAISLEVVGKGIYKANLVKLAEKLHVEDNVEFCEDLKRSELLEKYARADIFALLSKHEAYSICVAEALASRTPCIVARGSALEEWIDNENCFGIDNPILLERLAELINQVSTTTVERPPKLPDWDEIVDKLSSIYSR